MSKDHEEPIFKIYKTTFTPEGQKESDKTCWNCKKIKPASKYGFKYEVRDGVKGRVRTSSCLECKDSDTKIKDTAFQSDTKDRINYLEKKVNEYESDIKELKDDNKKLQLLLFNLSGSFEMMKISAAATVAKHKK